MVEEIESGKEIEKVETEKEEVDVEGQKFINQETVNNKINKLTFEKHEERRKADALKLERDEANQKLQDLTAKAEDIVIPEMPEVFDTEYEAKIKLRDEAITKKAEAKAEKNTQEAVNQTRLQNAQIESQKVIQINVNRMYKEGLELGFTEAELADADKKVATFISDPSLGPFILAQEDSACIVKYLGSSAQELDKISNMNPMEASAYIATTVAPRAAALKPDVTGAPKPIYIPKGKGAKNDSPFLQGCKFE